MSITRKFVVAVVTIAGLFPGSGIVAPVEAGATAAFNVDQAGPTITIANSAGAYLYDPAQLEAKAGQAITVTNKDTRGVHSVTAQDRSFSVDVPPQGSATLTISEPGIYPYYCLYHAADHNAASITVS